MNNLLRLVAVAGLIFVSSVSAQDASRAAAIAAQQDAAEQYKRLSAQIDDLWAANTAYNKRLEQMGEDLRKVRAELLAELSKNEASSGKYVTRDELKKLVDSINDIDKKRADDKALILEEIRKLTKLVASAPPPMAPPTSSKRDKEEPPKENDTAPTVNMKGFEHVVKSGEYLMTIINAYNEALKERGATKKITLDMVLKANPKLDPKRMSVGTKVFIPDPNQ